MTDNKSKSNDKEKDKEKNKEKKKKKSVKCRTWTFVLYPEDEGYTDLLNYLHTDNIERIRGCYINHVAKPKVDKKTGESVIDENGAPVMLKPHTHVMVQFPSPRSASGVIKSLCLYKDDAYDNEHEEDEENTKDIDTACPSVIGGKKCIRVEPVSDISSMYYYFMHWSYACQRANKERYDEKDIHQLGNDSADFVLSCKGERDLTKRVACSELLQHSEKCNSARDLLLECIDDEYLVKFMMKNPYFVKEFIIKRRA